MPDETPRTAASEHKSPNPAPRNFSSPPEEGVQTSPAEESLEDYESPKHRIHSVSQASRTSNRIPRASQSPIPRKSVVEKWQEDTPSSICLCQPDPKVPRPRNAFILYRQHHQQAVVAQNPGLANPEISKIIGDHWRNSSTETKEHWKLLADEEKLRHQKQYPDYRYQPRRSIRNSSVSGLAATTAEGDQRRCQKCGGRSIAASAMMSGPGPGFSNPPATPYSPSQPPNSATSAGRFMRSLGSPPTSIPTGNTPAGYRHRPSSANVASLTLSSPRYKRQDAGQPSPRFKRPEPSQSSPRSPDPKRRRITNASYAPIRAPNNPATPFAFPTGQRRQSLPRPDFMGPSINSPFTMGPPPRPHNTQHHPENSLTLAPLQNPPTSTTNMGIDTQAKSLEAMILSIPTLGKIRILARISPPLTPPTPTSASAQTPNPSPPRGLIIAIDATDPASLDALTATISSNLSTSYAPRVFQTPKPDPASPPTFQSYLRLMDAYHTLSTQLIAHITSSTSSNTNQTDAADPSSTSTAANNDPGANIQEGEEIEEEGEEEDQDTPMSSPSPISPKSFPKPRQKPHPRPSTTTTTTILPQSSTTLPPQPPSNTTTTPTPHHPLPIALVPSYQVTLADWFASRVEIRDAYSPMDHWQWGATLWRNIVGADVTVAVQGAVGVPGTGGEEGGKESGGGRNGGVEVRLEDARAVIVRGEREGLGEGRLRRVGFEIGEWVRGWEERGGMGGRRGS